MLTDIDRVRQILINLISNAIKFSNFGETVRINCEQIVGFDTMTELRIRVKDRGAGMTEQVRRNLFKPFHMDNTAEALLLNPKGHGLGLSICHKIVEAFDGNISVTSKEGQGSTFTVSLPMVFVATIARGENLQPITPERTKKKMNSAISVVSQIVKKKQKKSTSGRARGQGKNQGELAPVAELVDEDEDSSATMAEDDSGDEELLQGQGSN